MESKEKIDKWVQTFQELVDWAKKPDNNLRKNPNEEKRYCIRCLKREVMKGHYLCDICNIQDIKE
jgi:hypothetical protein